MMAGTHANGSAKLEDPGYEDFGDDYPPPGHVRIDNDADNEWRSRLATRTVEGKNGKPDREVVIPNLANVVTILSEHPDWRGCLAYDLFAERPITKKAPPWHADDAPPSTSAGELTDTDVSRFILWLYRAERLTIPDKVVMQAIGIVAEKNPVHPVRDYLRSLKWDAKQRLPDAASTYFGAEATEYTRAVIPRWFISAVARIAEPGAQCDCVLVLEGRTGWRKSSAFRSLVPVREWYADSGIVIGSKDSYQNIHGVWIYGFDELDSLSKSELTATKNFITQTFDRFRPPYGKVARNFRRQNIFSGSTNKDDYLNDPTGDRRYWPLQVRRPIDVHALVRDRDQLWAEAVARYDSGEPWHVDTPELRRLCEAEQSKRSADDAWAPLVNDWLENPTTRDPSDGLPKRLELAKGVTTTDVLLGALGMKAADIKRADETRAGIVLRQLGYSHVKRDTEGARARRYFKPSEEEKRLADEGCTDLSPCKNAGSS
jgi:putative DNA primase/helicase